MVPSSQSVDLTSPILCVWSFASSSGATHYETQLRRNGQLSCDCPGWTFARGGVRECKHTRQVSYYTQRLLDGRMKPQDAGATAPGTATAVLLNPGRGTGKAAKQEAAGQESFIRRGRKIRDLEE